MEQFAKSKDRIVLLGPCTCDEFILRPQYRYDLPIVINYINSDGVNVSTQTKHKTEMLIPIKDWNRYVTEGIIKRKELAGK